MPRGGLLVRTRSDGHGDGEGRNSRKGVRPLGRGQAAPIRKPQKAAKVSLSKALKAQGVKTENEDGLRPVEAKIVENFVKNGGVKEKAVIDAGEKKSAVSVFNKPEVQKAILIAFDKAGITDDLLAKKIRDGLEATQVKVHEGQVVCEVPDFIARHKYVDLSLKVRGDIGEGMTLQNANVQYNSFKDE